MTTDQATEKKESTSQLTRVEIAQEMHNHLHWQRDDGLCNNIDKYYGVPSTINNGLGKNTEQ